MKVKFVIYHNSWVFDAIDYLYLYLQEFRYFIDLNESLAL